MIVVGRALGVREPRCLLGSSVEFGGDVVEDAGARPSIPAERPERVWTDLQWVSGESGD
jgi:hypothetical protein